MILPNYESRALRDVIAERQRQIHKECFDFARDDAHVTGGMAVAAACYADASTWPPGKREDRKDKPPSWWPWSSKWWKITTPRRDLVKAAALLLAEIERLDRRERDNEDQDDG